MKVLYIHQYFKTPQEPGGTRSYWISQQLIAAGHNVTMVTSQNKQKEKVVYKTIDGIDVIYIKNDYDNSFSILQRVKSFVKFIFQSYSYSKSVPDVDLVFATSTPLTIGIPALLLKLFKRIPFVFEVRDLWPEVPIQMGALNNSLLRKLAITLEKHIYAKAKHIIALSPGMQNGVLKRGISPDKVSMVPNMAKVDEFYPREVSSHSYEKYRVSKDKLKVIHFGAMGLANGIDYIVEAAKILNDKSCSDVEIIFAGGGSQEPAMQAMVRQYQLDNVIFLGKFSMVEMSELVNLCDCSLVSFANIPILKTNSPNKLFDSLSAAKPIIVNSAGWTKTMVEEHGCGAYVDVNHPQELADLLMNWSLNRPLLLEMGAKSRQLAESQYDKSILTQQVVDIIDNL